jgi:hypothetical protein
LRADLALAELTVALEARLGVSLPEGALRPELTVDDVRALVEGRAPAVTAEPELTWTPPLWLFGPGRGVRFLAWPLEAV